MTTKFARNFGLAVILFSLFFMQGDLKAQRRDSDAWNGTKTAIGGSALMFGAGAALCGAMNLGCPVGIAIGGAVMGGIGGGLALMPLPEAPPMGSFPGNGTCGWSCGGPLPPSDQPVPANFGGGLVPDTPSYGNGSLSGGGGTFAVGSSWSSNPYIMLQGAQKRVTLGSVAKSVMSHVNWRESAINVGMEGFTSMRQRQPRAIPMGQGGLPRFGPLAVTARPAMAIPQHAIPARNVRTGGRF